ncbi:MAG: hypothetical protein JW757_02005 [Anaerolineales bacterium]|nr:hypothetical protein [Anaerolineales bacterium]
MRSGLQQICFLLKPLSALLRWIAQTFLISSDGDELDDSIISISANRMRF